LHRSQPALTESERNVVAAALHSFDGVRYDLHPFVIMDDHVHVLVGPRPGYELTRICASWKSWTANQLQRGFRAGTCRIWQHEVFDHIVRGEHAFRRILRYVVENPVRRWPGIDVYPWVWWRQE
jgi:REP element-mobilizing transposase RayT